MTGALHPGERLLIDDLAKDLNLSAMPVREALRQLDAVGLVDSVPHRGARVTELSVDDLRDVYEARLALELLAVWQAAERFSDEDARVAHDAIQAHIRAYKDLEPRIIWSTHTAFHFAIYTAARSRWLTRLITPLWESSERYRFAMLPLRVNVAQRRYEHERILDACIAHKPEVASSELRNHLVRTVNLISKQMGSGDLFPLVEIPTKSDRRRE